MAFAGVVRYLARRFASRGEPVADLIQVGMIGLLKAIDRFDPQRGWEFVTFATPTIVGEIKRHFRDRCWALHVPRRLRDLSLAVTRAAGELSVSLGRSATVDDIARHLDVSSEKVLEAQEASHGYGMVSLDAEMNATDGAAKSARLGERIGELDPAIDLSESAASLAQACKSLDAGERVVIYLRFYQELPQTEIARRLNVSQMNVSRVQRRALRKLQQHMAGDELQLAAQMQA